MVPGTALRTARLSALSAALLFAPAAVPASGAEAFSLPPTQGPSAYHSAVRAGQVPAFFDRLLRSQLALDGIPGAVVALVQGDETLDLGGFGKADLASGEPVSAQETLFRTGSVSKLVTWTAVMQLLERGVVVSPGRAFGSGGEGYIRLALVPTLEECEQAVDVLVDCLGS